MLNPNDIVSAYVTALQSVPEVVAALGGNAATIQAYDDSTNGSFNIRKAIMEMPEPSILAAWMGSGPATEGLGVFSHDISLFVRAGDQAPFADIVTAVMNARQPGSVLKILNTELLPGLQHMVAPTTRRIQDEEAEIDMFEITTKFEESLDTE